jgi:hypothetical protein
MKHVLSAREKVASQNSLPEVSGTKAFPVETPAFLPNKNASAGIIGLVVRTRRRVSEVEKALAAVRALEVARVSGVRALEAARVSEDATPRAEATPAATAEANITAEVRNQREKP